MKHLTISALTVLISLSAASAFANDAVTPPPQPPHGKPMFEKNDVNKDGAISKDEWRARGDQMFSDTDANGDGKVTPDEMKAHHEKKRTEWKERREERKELRDKLKATHAPAPAAAPVEKH